MWRPPRRPLPPPTLEEWCATCETDLREWSHAWFTWGPCPRLSDEIEAAHAEALAGPPPLPARPRPEWLQHPGWRQWLGVLAKEGAVNGWALGMAIGNRAATALLLWAQREGWLHPTRLESRPPTEWLWWRGPRWEAAPR